MDQLDLHEVERMFTDYRSLERQFWESKFEQEKEQFEVFKARFIPFQAGLQALKKTEAPYFNIFDILNIKHRETKLHTPFLCHLLDPNASHEQSSLFLDSFFQQALRLPFDFQSINDFIVREEKRTTDLGQLDIFIRFVYHGKLKALVIENKINSGDQDDQLDRYYRYLTDVLQLDSEDYWLFYLTKHGTQPNSKSIDPVLAEELRGLQCLFEIGYYQHITPWLNHCYYSISSQKVKDIIGQYLITLSLL
jgi:hypothetical protein